MRYATPHATARLAERHGVTATDDDWRDVILAITARPPSAIMTRRLDNGVEEWIARVASVAVRLVYDPKYVCVVTVLSRG